MGRNKGLRARDGTKEGRKEVTKGGSHEGRKEVKEVREGEGRKEGRKEGPYPLLKKELRARGVVKAAAVGHKR